MTTLANMAVDDDMRAINDFFHRADVAPRTPEAKKIFNEWVGWWEVTNDSWMFTQADFDHARNLRNAYNRANAVTPHEKEVAERVITTGMSGEQQRGEPDRRDAQGNLPEPPPEQGLTHRWWFWPAVASGATATVVLVLPKALKLYLGVR